MSPKDGLLEPLGTDLDFCEATQGLGPVWLHSVAHVNSLWLLQHQPPPEIYLGDT